MPAPSGAIERLRKELALLIVATFLGMVALPIAIYWVGGQTFGEYAGGGFWDFFSRLSARLRGGDAVAWFLVLSPYLAVGILRLTLWGLRLPADGRRRSEDRSE